MLARSPSAKPAVGSEGGATGVGVSHITRKQRAAADMKLADLPARQHAIVVVGDLAVPAPEWRGRSFRSAPRVNRTAGRGAELQLGLPHACTTRPPGNSCSKAADSVAGTRRSGEHRKMQSGKINICKKLFAADTERYGGTGDQNCRPGPLERFDKPGGRKNVEQAGGSTEGSKARA